MQKLCGVVGAIALTAGVGLISGDLAAAEEDRPPERPVVITDPVPAGFRSWDEVHAVQSRISAVTDRVDEVAATADGAGYGSIVSEPAARRFTLHWKGALPESVRTVLDEAVDVSVVVRPAPFSDRELQAEITRMMSYRGPAEPANRVTGAAPLPDAGGLKVFVSGDAASGRELPEVRAAAVPVVVKGGVAPQVTSRANDMNPYWGGANWTGGGGCSTGFAVSLGGVTKMLSAGHCAANGTNATDGGGDVMGLVTGTNSPMLDALLINTSAQGRVFNGGPGSGEYHNPVIGRHFNHVGDYVCTSGALSGTRCGIEITDTNVTQTFSQGPGQPLVTFNRMSVGEQQDDLNASGNGDSGGPVFQVDANPTKVWAKGTITGGEGGSAKCTGVPESSTRQCSSTVWYTSIAQSLNTFGATIVVG